jgi:2-(1,2-epoxy-1,2-dihydrophenyl)acetyl-CoA isomerase
MKADLELGVATAVAEAPMLLRTLEEGVLTLTLNRPDRLNALTWELMRRLLDALNEAAIDPGVRVVVLGGAGRGFCAGGDIRSREQLDPADPVSEQWAGTPAWRSQEVRASQVLKLSASTKLLHTMPKPTIAMVRGPAAGAGLCLAAACDMRIASETARFTTAFASVARSGDFGGSYLLTHLVGAAKARELYFFADKIEANDALRIGLVNRVVADAELEVQTMALARRLAEGPAAAYRYIKRNLNAAETMTFDQVVEMETYNMMRCSQTEDARELLNAAKEGRTPKYQGF